jgi:beta-lactam-binding protein with PASTA domain
MPDVRGLSLRSAIRVLKTAGLLMRPTGDGFVIDQYPEPGASIEDIRWAALRLARGPKR